MALIFWFSSQSNLPQQPSAHVGEYAILGLLLLRAFARGAPIAAPRPAMLAWIVAVLYAASDEFHQAFTPGRTPTPVDVLIDAAGVTIALYLARCWGTRVHDLSARQLGKR